MSNKRESCWKFHCYTRNIRTGCGVREIFEKDLLTFCKFWLWWKPTSDILNFMRHYLKVNFSVNNVATCHPLNYNSRSPVVGKFTIQADRDIVWRKNWLKIVRNLRNLPFMIEECLASRDRELKQEARQLGLPVYTHKQNMYARDANSLWQDPIASCEVQHRA